MRQQRFTQITKSKSDYNYTEVWRPFTERVEVISLCSWSWE